MTGTARDRREEVADLGPESAADDAAVAEPGWSAAGDAAVAEPDSSAGDDAAVEAIHTPPAKGAAQDPLVTLVHALAHGEVGRDLHAARPPESGRRRSAVLVLFVGDAIVFVQRSLSLRKHAGQVAFPGGALDPGETNVEAALRETWEETGLDPSQITVLGEMPATNIPVSGFDVVPVIGWWRGGEISLTGWDPQEIAGVHVVPVAQLVDPTNRFTAVNRQGFKTPGFDVAPLWIWGFTAFVLDAVLRASGWEQPWDRTDVRPVPRNLAG